MTEPYKAEFIEFMVRCQVLRFGDFTAKSGRKTPYFIDSGRYSRGAQVAQLGRFYADAICRSGLTFSLLFGPAYKGIPLVVATAIALQERGIDAEFCFNRKEEKDHGEGGHFVGRAPVKGDRVLILEDVTTAGTSIRETAPMLLKPGKVTLAGLLVAVDRMERGIGEQSALTELASTYGMPCHAIVSVEDIVTHLHRREIEGRVVLDDQLHAAMQAYRAQYGAPAGRG